MGRAHIALAVIVVASICGWAAQVVAIELGELQAVPSNSPPYIFRLPLITPLHGPSASGTVTVRQPPGALSFVKQHVVELRLRSLTDVELEVSYGEQTLNRLLLKTELQAARMRLEMAPASNLSPPARAKGRDRPFSETSSVTQAPEGASHRPLFERELEGIRREIQRLVERVTPWEELSPPLADRGEVAITVVLTLLLGGFFSVGVTSLIMGYLMQRRASDRERRRRRALTLSIRRMQDQHAAGVSILPALAPAPAATSWEMRRWSLLPLVDVYAYHRRGGGGFVYGSRATCATPLRYRTPSVSDSWREPPSACHPLRQNSSRHWLSCEAS